MAPRQPQTKEQILAQLVQDIVFGYFKDRKGLISTSKSELQSYLRLAEKNKSGSPSAYYLVKALVNMVNNEFIEAERNCNNARRLAPDDNVILANHATILLRLYRYSEVKRHLKELTNRINVLGSDAVMTNLYSVPLLTLDIDFIKELKGIPEVGNWIGYLESLENLKKDINLIGIPIETYTEFMEILENFIVTETRQNFMPRFKTINGLDRHLVIEIFLDINVDEAAYLDSEFTNRFLDYVFDKERYDLLGKFVVFFRQNKNRADGTKNPDMLYLGMDEELGA